MLKPRGLLSLIGIYLVTLLVACGGGDDNGDSSRSPTGNSDAPGTPSGGNPPAASSSPASGGNVAGANVENACQLLTRDEVRMAVGAADRAIGIAFHQRMPAGWVVACAKRHPFDSLLEGTRPAAHKRSPLPTVVPGHKRDRGVLAGNQLENGERLLRRAGR